MTEKITILRDFQPVIERARAMPYNKGNHQYARVYKFVPREWLNEEVIIMRAEDFNTLLKLFNKLIDLTSELLIKETKKEMTIEKSTKIKLSRKDLNF